ncbi:MAG: hypothetical protein WCJ30_05355 [Deltaproteobacteria bacterium]
MKRLSILTVLSLAAVSAGCATTEIHARHAAIGNAVALVATGHDGRTVHLAVGALWCMLGRGDEATCASIAQQAWIPTEALTRANQGSIEQVTERLAVFARAEGMSTSNRGALMRWFDLGAGAVREARAARSGAACTRAEACRARAQGSPSADDVEGAWRIDVRSVQAHVAFDALVASVVDAEDYAPEVQATAMAIFADRIDAATSARPEVVGEAVATLGALQAALDNSGDARGVCLHPAHADPVAAHGTGAETGETMERARTTLHRLVAGTSAAGAPRMFSDFARSIDASTPAMATHHGSSASPSGV